MKKTVIFSKNLLFLNRIRLSVATGRRSVIEANVFFLYWTSLICFAVVTARSSTEEESLNNQSLYPSGVVVVQSTGSGKTRQFIVFAAGA
jgi:hypothetical protein